MDDVGLANGEEAERVFSQLGKLSSSTRSMSAPSRIDHITLFAMDLNEERMRHFVRHAWFTLRSAVRRKEEAIKELQQVMAEVDPALRCDANTFLLKEDVYHEWEAAERQEAVEVSTAGETLATGKG